MDTGDIITLLVAIVAAASAYASQRAAARASTITSRMDMEKEAYERARKFDIETIARQDAEIEELRKDNRDLHEKIAVARSEAREARAEAREAHAENNRLRERIAVLEHGPFNPPQTS